MTGHNTWHFQIFTQTFTGKTKMSHTYAGPLFPKTTKATLVGIQESSYRH